jgi:hypothetical protein
LELNAAGKLGELVPHHLREMPSDEVDDYEAHTILAAKVRNGQRTSQSFCQAWWTYVDALPIQDRDPFRHSRQTLAEFLAKHTPDCDVSTGKNPYAQPPAFGPSILAHVVKIMQRSKMAWKHQWDEHCDALGHGVKDPLRHPPAFLQQFVSGARPAVKPQHFEQAFRESKGHCPELKDQLQQIMLDAPMLCERQSDCGQASAISTVSGDISDASSESDHTEAPSGWHAYHCKSTNSPTGFGSGEITDHSCTSPPKQLSTRRRARSLPAARTYSKAVEISILERGFQYPEEIKVVNTFIHIPSEMEIEECIV